MPGAAEGGRVHPQNLPTPAFFVQVTRFAQPRLHVPSSSRFRDAHVQFSLLPVVVEFPALRTRESLEDSWLQGVDVMHVADVMQQEPCPTLSPDCVLCRPGPSAPVCQGPRPAPALILVIQHPWPLCSHPSLSMSHSIFQSEVWCLTQYGVCTAGFKGSKGARRVTVSPQLSPGGNG